MATEGLRQIGPDAYLVSIPAEYDTAIRAAGAVAGACADCRGRDGEECAYHRGWYDGLFRLFRSHLDGCPCGFLVIAYDDAFDAARARRTA